MATDGQTAFLIRRSRLIRDRQLEIRSLTVGPLTSLTTMDQIDELSAPSLIRVELDELTKAFIAFTESPADGSRETRLSELLTAESEPDHWVRAAYATWNLDRPNEQSLLVRLQTELYRLRAAVRIQADRIPFFFAARLGELLTEPADEPLANTEQAEADLHFLVAAATSLYACAYRACNLLTKNPGVDEPATLRATRNLSQHIDEYNAGDGRNADIRWTQVQTWQLEVVDSERIWRWGGIDLNIDQIVEAALATADRVQRAIADEIKEGSSGTYLLAIPGEQAINLT